MMRAGDIVALYSENFRLAVAADIRNLVVIYQSKQIEYQSIDLLLDNINDLSSILSTVLLPEDRFEIYKTNILITPKQLKKTTKDLFKFLVINLKKFKHSHTSQFFRATNKKGDFIKQLLERDHRMLDYEKKFFFSKLK